MSTPHVHLWDTVTGRPRWRHAAHDGEITSLAFTPDGRALVSGARDGTIRVWAAASGRQECELAGHRWGVSAVAVLPDGQAVLSAGSDGCLRLQELHTGGERRRFVIDQQPETLIQPVYLINHIDLAADGRTAVSFSEANQRDPLLHVWDLTKGQILVQRACEHGDDFKSFSPDAKLLVGYAHTVRRCQLKIGAGSNDGEVIPGTTQVVLEEVATARRVLTLPQPDSSSHREAFSPDGQTLATATYRVVREGDTYRVDRHAIHLWELASGKERLRITIDETGDRLDYPQVVFSADGRTLATTLSRDNTIQIWDVATGQELLRRTGYDADVQALAFAPNGRATGHVDSTILLWDLAPERWQRTRPSRPLDAHELEAAWMDLASADARKAHAAIWKLIAVPRQAVSFLRERLRPAPAVPADRFRQLLRAWDLPFSDGRFVPRLGVRSEYATGPSGLDPAGSGLLPACPEGCESAVVSFIHSLSRARSRYKSCLARPIPFPPSFGPGGLSPRSKDPTR